MRFGESVLPVCQPGAEMTPIPVRLEPFEWEQLGGYVLRLARATRCSLSLLASHLGLQPPDRVRPLARSVWPLAPAGLARFARLVDQPEAAIQGMTVAAFRTRLIEVRDSNTQAGADIESPSLVAGGMHCPDCVLEQHWDLRWKTGLTAVCVRHRAFLRATCPTCVRPLAPDLILAGQSPPDAALRHGVRAGSSCEGRVVRASAVPSPTALHVQETLDRLLSEARHSLHAASLCRDVLRWAEYLNRGTSSRPLIAGGACTVEGPDLAPLLNDALELARLDAVPQAAPRALERSARLQDFRGRNSRIPPRYKPLARGATDTVLAVHQLVVLLDRPLPVAPFPGYHGLPEMLPQAVPASVFAPMLSDLLGDLGYDRARNVAAISLQARGGESAWPRIAHRMGLPGGIGRYAQLVISHLLINGTADQYWEAVDQARAAILRERIDFARRAQAVTGYGTGADAARARWPALTSFPDRAVKQWLLDRWACQHIGTLPAGLAGGAHAGLTDERVRVDEVMCEDVEISSFWKTWRWEVGEQRAAG